jgi:uncharacterized coiled-coil protein SlyX
VTPLRESISQEYRSASSSPSTAESATPPARFPSQAEDLQALKDLIIKKDLELESMKTELRLLRQQLDDRDTQSEALKKKKKPAPKSQSTLP